MNFRALALAVSLLVTWSGAAIAVPVTYDLTLAATILGSASGTGILTLDAPVPAGSQSYGPGPTSAVDIFKITIGDRTFDFTNSFTHVGFEDGNLVHVEFSGMSSIFSLNAYGMTYSYGNFFDIGPSTLGTITAKLEATAAVPEPSTWAMLLLGFAGIGFVTYRRGKLAPVPV